jgi:hypothetical protein
MFEVPDVCEGSEVSEVSKVKLQIPQKHFSFRNLIEVQTLQ